MSKISCYLSLFCSIDPSHCETTIACEVDAKSSFNPSLLTTKLAGLKEHVIRCGSVVNYSVVENDETAMIVADEEEVDALTDSTLYDS